MLKAYRPVIAQKHSPLHLGQIALGVERQATRDGLKINTVKIKDLSLTGRSIFPIGTNGQNVEGVNQFVYLGSVDSADGSIDFDIIRRSNSVRLTFVVFSKIWQS